MAVPPFHDYNAGKIAAKTIRNTVLLMFSGAAVWISPEQIYACLVCYVASHVRGYHSFSHMAALISHGHNLRTIAA